MYVRYDYYRIFYYVAKYKSFTRAAEELFLNQPNVTRTIKNLENELGCVLFARSNRGVQLTPEGERLYDHIRIAIEHIQAGEEELAMEKQLQGGSITIGASEVALHCLLLPILKKFRSMYPGIRVRVSNHSTPQALDALKNGFVDLAVVTTPTGIEEKADLKQIPLRTVREIPVCGGAFAALRGRKLTLEELCRYPLICLSSGTATGAFYDRLFAAKGLTLSPEIEAATADQILPLVCADLGIGFIPTDFVRGDRKPENLILLELAEPLPERQICLVKNTAHTQSLVAKELEKMLLNSIC